MDKKYDCDFYADEKQNLIVIPLALPVPIGHSIKQGTKIKDHEIFELDEDWDQKYHELPNYSLWIKAMKKVVQELPAKRSKLIQIYKGPKKELIIENPVIKLEDFDRTRNDFQQIRDAWSDITKKAILSDKKQNKKQNLC